MQLIQTVSPRWQLDEFFPPRSVFAPRTTLDRLRWVTNEEYRLDSLTGVTMSVMGSMPLICHRNTATPQILEFFQNAGVNVARDLLLYDDQAGAERLATEMVSQGGRLASPYLPLPCLDRDEALVVPSPLYRWLNDKANIDSLVPGEHLPPHVQLSVERLEGIREELPGRAVFVKVCHAGAAGGGKDLRYCPDQDARARAIDWLATRRSEFNAVRIEEAVSVRTSWGINIAIMESGVRFLGAATQLFSEPGQQSGSRIDPDDQPPAQLRSAVELVALRARERGFRGVAGIDAAVTDDGSPVLFDLNFRLTSSTAQVLLYDAAVARRGARVAQLWNAVTEVPLADALRRLRPFAEEGSFVPLRIFEANAMSGGKSTITGFVVGRTAAEADGLEAILRESLIWPRPAGGGV